MPGTRFFDGRGVRSTKGRDGSTASFVGASQGGRRSPSAARQCLAGWLAVDNVTLNVGTWQLRLRSGVAPRCHGDRRLGNRHVDPSPGRRVSLNPKVMSSEPAEAGSGPQCQKRPGHRSGGAGCLVQAKPDKTASSRTRGTARSSAKALRLSRLPPWSRAGTAIRLCFIDCLRRGDPVWSAGA